GRLKIKIIIVIINLLPLVECHAITNSWSARLFLLRILFSSILLTGVLLCVLLDIFLASPFDCIDFARLVIVRLVVAPLLAIGLDRDDAFPGRDHALPGTGNHALSDRAVPLSIVQLPLQPSDVPILLLLAAQFGLDRLKVLAQLANHHILRDNRHSLGFEE